MIVELGAVRDLIEAGLSEPADAATRYGISVAALDLGDALWVTRFAVQVLGDPEPPVLVDAIDASTGILVRVAIRRACPVADRRDAGRRISLRPSTLLPRRRHDRCSDRSARS